MTALVRERVLKEKGTCINDSGDAGRDSFPLGVPHLQNVPSISVSCRRAMWGTCFSRGRQVVGNRPNHFFRLNFPWRKHRHQRKASPDACPVFIRNESFCEYLTFNYRIGLLSPIQRTMTKRM